MPIKWPIRDPDNQDRAFWAYSSLHNFAERTSTVDNLKEEPAEVLSALLCDLEHWANQNGVSFDDCVARGNGHYRAEIEEEQS